MDESHDLNSNKKLWISLLVCIIVAAVFLSASRGFPAESVGYVVFKVLGLFILVAGIFVAIIWSTRYENQELPVSSSIWISVNRAEQIVLERDVDRAMLEDILRDLRDYEKRYKIAYPPILEQRIGALEKKLRK